MLPIFEFIEENIIGGNTRFVGPYGEKKVIYCDYTASGKPLRFIENYIRDYVYPFYANTHTTTSVTSRQTTRFRQEARSIIKECVNATDEDVVVFTGSGTTSAIHKLIHALQLEERKHEKHVVFVGPFEHHSNILPWKETGAKIVRIDDNDEGTVDMDMLQENLQKYKSANYFMYVAFSAASNVTGILTDTVAVAELCHKYGALSFWDYAAAGPYLKIDMNPTQNGYKDAVFLSPHKFVGGTGTPGLLIAKKSVFKNPVPGGCGGGTVLFVTRDTHLYLKDIEEREEGGTPAIVESIRAGMVFQLKQSVGTTIIEEREEQLCKKAFEALNDNPNIAILGNDTATRLPIFSILIYHQDSGKLVHHNFVSVLLNDLYGIQARGGCACAGPYAQDLLGLNESMAKKFIWFLEKHENDDVGGLLKEPLEIMKPGFARVGLPYFMNDKTVDFVLNAVNMVATHGWKLLPQYHFDPHTGAWEHKQFKKDNGETLFSLYDVNYQGATGMNVKTNEVCRDYEGSLDDIAEAAEKVFKEAVDVNKEISTAEEEVIEFTDDRNQLVWFLQPNEAQFYLAAETLKYKPKPFGRAKPPFNPRHGHSPRISPQISPAGSIPNLHLDGHVVNGVDTASSRSNTDSSGDSDDATQKQMSLREDWQPKESHKKASGGKKKKCVIQKLKHALGHVSQH
ncbi:putative cysteine desulfurase isoform X1 [Oculina patagonica]